MSTFIYLISTALIGVGTWLILNAAWRKELSPPIILLISIGVAAVWPFVLVGLLVIGILIFINKSRKA